MLRHPAQVQNSTRLIHSEQFNRNDSVYTKMHYTSEDAFYHTS